MFAVTNGDLEMVQELVRAGANPLIATKDGRNPLSFAETESSRGITDILQGAVSTKSENAPKQNLQDGIIEGRPEKGSHSEVKQPAENSEAKAEYSKMSKERAMKEKKAREQAQKEQGDFQAETAKAKQQTDSSQTNKKQPTSIFSMFGM
jgi:hypothetical protein